MPLLFFVLAAAFLNLASCAITQIKDVSAYDVPKADFVTAYNDAETLVQYAAYLRRLSAPELTREHETTKLNAAKSKSDLNRAQLAMIYALPGLPLHDDAKALVLLEPLGKEAASPAVRNFALLLMSFVADNKRLDEGTQVLAGKLKDEQKQSAELQQKLEALKSIEKSLSDRDRGKQPAASHKQP